ncbi:hypothetical protein TOPH_02720 [Tolypocladium ophioglossoides CBS 100239]|uniref:EKC/KEOPS complex subunit GON7 n=1 Tax=Tolypocladium ophioglossoides (strain CBS 100239) TaxID=1163406 RepID=A0A0L0NEU1_TOLOC|nr:hypothetical protein TOPH_02720 [Tolypocladium ophioglossoides CBS 100239]
MSQKYFKLTAEYTSPTNEPFSVAARIPSAPSSSVADKTTYLATLSIAIGGTQDSINEVLTQRMDEDKVRDGAAKPAVDEDKEEENYGEEVQDED